MDKLVALLLSYKESPCVYLALPIYNILHKVLLKSQGQFTIAQKVQATM